jgi:hypothetical protein
MTKAMIGETSKSYCMKITRHSSRWKNSEILYNWSSKDNWKKTWSEKGKRSKPAFSGTTMKTNSQNSANCPKTTNKSNH